VPAPGTPPAPDVSHAYDAAGLLSLFRSPSRPTA